MESVCHRCSATVEPDAFYCTQCGAPQVRYVPPEENAEAAAGTVIGTLSAEAGAEASRSLHTKLAIQIAVSVAFCVGILSTLLAAGSVLWVAGGTVIAIGIYHRRRPQALLGRRMGARMGALVGLLTAFFALAGNGLFLVIQRYGMHQGNEIDTQLTNIVTQAAARAAGMDPQAPVASFTGFWLSPEGRVGLILLTMGFLSALIVVFAIAGGVLGAQIYRSPGRKALP